MNTPEKGKLAGTVSEALLARAYDVESQEDSLALYRDWADTYDDHLEQGLNYIAPRLMADMFAEYVADADAAVVDIGTGTGLTGLYVARRGFGVIDGIDISPDMLREASGKGLYRSLIEADLTGPLDIPDATYDAAVSSGTFTHAHVGAGALDEILRILKPDALFVCSINSEVWVENGFGPKIRELTQSGAMHVLEIRPSRYFKFDEMNGRFCVFQKGGD